MSSDPEPSRINIRLLTISDTRTAEDDQSGKLMHTFFEDHDYSIENQSIVREDREKLAEAFRDSTQEENVDVVVSSGGTGISSRDQTYEVVKDLVDKQLPGFGELFRQLSYEEVGAYTIMSRAIAGRVNDTLIIALPGSTNAVQLALEDILLEVLPHMVKEVRK